MIITATAVGVAVTKAAGTTALIAKWTLPPEIDDILKQLQLLAGGVVVGLATLMGMAAGLMRTLGLREEGKKRFNDAMAGMGMVITAPAIFGLLATILRAIMPDTAL